MSADLHPGPELDARIASEIMGSRIRLSASSLLDGRIWLAAREFPAGATKERDVPYYSTDIGAAWLIVERLRAAGIEVIIGCLNAGFALELRLPSEVYRSSEQPSLPLALCEAALRPETLAALKVEASA